MKRNQEPQPAPASSADSGSDASFSSSVAEDLQSTNLSASSAGKEHAPPKNFQFIGKFSIAMGLNENLVRVGLELCPEERKWQIEEKWKQLFLEESDLYSKKLELAGEARKMIAEALKSLD